MHFIIYITKSIFTHFCFISVLLWAWRGFSLVLCNCIFWMNLWANHRYQSHFDSKFFLWTWSWQWIVTIWCKIGVNLWSCYFQIYWELIINFKNHMSVNTKLKSEKCDKVGKFYNFDKISTNYRIDMWIWIVFGKYM